MQHVLALYPRLNPPFSMSYHNNYACYLHKIIKRNKI